MHQHPSDPIALAGLVENRRQSQSWADCLGSLEPRRNVDRGAEGQRHHGTDTRDGHQAPADFIVPDDRQHFAVKCGEALPQTLTGRSVKH
jgi:hypothetical protein